MSSGEQSMKKVRIPAMRKKIKNKKKKENKTKKPRTLGAEECNN